MWVGAWCQTPPSPRWLTLMWVVKPCLLAGCSKTYLAISHSAVTFCLLPIQNSDIATEQVKYIYCEFELIKCRTSVVFTNIAANNHSTLFQNDEEIAAGNLKMRKKKHIYIWKAVCTSAYTITFAATFAATYAITYAVGFTPTLYIVEFCWKFFFSKMLHCIVLTDTANKETLWMCYRVSRNLSLSSLY